MTREIIPLIPVPRLTDARMKELYDKLMNQPTKPTPGNIRNPEDYIFLEAKQHGTYSYPDLLVSMHRLGLNEDVQKAANKLDLIVTNTAQEQDGHQYIGNINHEQAIKLVIESGYIPVNLRLFVDFLKEIKSGLNGKKKVYDGDKNIVPYNRLLTAWNEITEVRELWRGEWFSDQYTKLKGKFYVSFYKINNRELEPVTEQLDQDILMVDRPINFEDWLNNATVHGTPRNNSFCVADLRYWHPIEEGKAWFGIINSEKRFGCDMDSSYLNTWLGIRPARIKE
ncbi:hypothetical protein HYX19_00710 [Candidatus Woesearchaeota archaeon]|nr:hypothetical protein [Candidatus Woesearchaeota archaeon]